MVTASRFQSAIHLHFTTTWEQRKLGELAAVKDSARVPNSSWSDEGVPYIRASDISSGNLAGELFLPDEVFGYYSSQTGHPQRGDVLFNGGGEIGKARYYGSDQPIYVQGGAVLYVQTSLSNELDGRYLEAAFSSKTVKNYIDVSSAGGTMKHFTLGPSVAMPLFVPGVSEQRQIGSFFSSLDNLITLHQRKAALSS